MTEFEELYERYFKDVYTYLLSLTKEKYLAEDLTSETFIKVMNSLKTFKGDSHIKTWLFQIAKYTYISYLRKQKKEVPLELIVELEGSTNIEKEFLLREDWNQVQEILKTLPEVYSQIISLRLFGGLSFKKIGEHYGKSDNWASVTFYRAKIKIKKEMGKTE